MSGTLLKLASRLVGRLRAPLADPRQCPACNAARLRARRAGQSRKILECRACGHLFAAEPPDERALEDLHSPDHFAMIEKELGCRDNPDAWEGWKAWKEELLDFFGIDRSDAQARRVLDVGCGHGKLLELLADRGWECVGVDLSAAVDDLRLPPGIRIIRAAFDQHDFGEDRFDLAAMVHVLEHFVDPAAALGKTRRLLKVDGRLLVEVPLFIDLDDLHHQHFFSPDSLRHVLEKTGFAPLKERTYRDGLNPERENLVVLCGRKAS